MTKSFDTADVSEIGRSSFFGSVTCFALGKGVISASFRVVGSFCSLNDFVPYL